MQRLKGIQLRKQSKPPLCTTLTSIAVVNSSHVVSMKDAATSITIDQVIFLYHVSLLTAIFKRHL